MFLDNEKAYDIKTEKVIQNCKKRILYSTLLYLETWVIYRM